MMEEVIDVEAEERKMKMIEIPLQDMGSSHMDMESGDRGGGKSAKHHSRTEPSWRPAVRLLGRMMRSGAQRKLWIVVVLCAVQLMMHLRAGWAGHSLMMSALAVIASVVPVAALSSLLRRSVEEAPSYAHFRYREEVSRPCEYPFGLFRLEVLLSFTGSIGLGLVALIVLFEAIEHVVLSEDHPHLHHFSPAWGCAAAAVAVAMYWVSRVWVGRDAFFHAESASEDSSARHGGLLSVSAAVSCVSALCSGLGIGLADPLAGCVVSGLVLVDVWPSVRDSARVLLQGAPDTVAAEAQRRIAELCLLDGVVDCPEWHVWTLAPGLRVASIVLRIRPDLKDPQALLSYTLDLFQPSICSEMTIQIEKME